MYDLLILSLNQQKNTRLKADNICVKALNRHGSKTKKYYYEIWPFINNAHGILYKFFTREGLGEFGCCDEMFEFGIGGDWGTDLRQMIHDIPEECSDDWVSMKLSTQYEEEFVKILDVLLDSSPISMIAFLCSGQSLDKEIVLGTLSRDVFLEMLRLGSVKTNICYLIKKNFFDRWKV